MILVSYGLTKSGSTLAFEIAKAVLELNGHSQARLTNDLVTEGHGINFVRGWTDEKLSALIDATRGQRVAVKTHTTAARLSPELVGHAIDAGELKIQVVYRDPRDMILSMLDHGARARAVPHDGAFRDVDTLDVAIERLGIQLYRLRRWGSYPSLKLQYEKFAFDPVGGPRMIADDLGLTADPAEVWEIATAHFTQRHVGRAGRYKDDLWPEEIERVERAFPLFLELVNGNDLGWFGPPT